MGYPTITEIAEAVKEWDFIQNLPATIDSFQKQIEGKIQGQILYICSYTSAPLQAKLDIIYTAETFDYILVLSRGMNIYRDVGLIYKEPASFAENAQVKIPLIIHQMEHPEDVNLGEMVAAQKILTWDFGNNLPEQIGAFQLYIKPAKAIDYINGSIILIDYSDFTRGDQFVVYYSRHRNEFFGEIKINGVFHATMDFDAKNLTQLQEKLEQNLATTLSNISKADHEI